MQATRRQLVIGAAASTATLAAGYAIGANPSVTAVSESAEKTRAIDPLGIEGKLFDLIKLVALDISPETTKSSMARWMTLLTDSQNAYKNREAPSGDPLPELSESGLTLAVGFGPTLFERLGLRHESPVGFAAIPPFKIDELDPRYCDGDVLLQIQSNSPLELEHAARMLLRDAQEFASVRWIQDGFAQKSKVAGAAGKTTEVHRNLMGQVDGTDNPKPGTKNFADLVWMNAGPDWCLGGTQLVVRRIRMKLDAWDSLGRPQQESAIGRKIASGAPLGGSVLTDPVDLEARDANGLLIIPEFAHVRRASAQGMRERFLRRPYNYVSGNAPASESGLLFLAYAQNLTEQYLPVQKRLAEFDLLNVWTTPVGSSTFVIAPLPSEGEIIAQSLFA